MRKLLPDKAQAENAEDITNIQLSILSVSNNINSKVETGILHCLNQDMEKEVDNKKPETYKENSMYNENIKYIEDEDNLIDNQCFLDNKEKVNNEEKVETYEEQIETCEEEEEKSTNNENIEYFEDLIIDNNCLSDRINNIPKNIPEGRYIVDISYMWNEIHRTFDDHARGIECQFKYWQLVNFHRRGLLTQLFFKCQMCNYQTSIWTEPMHSEKSDINAVAAAGCAEVGIGYTQMRKLCTAMNIKYMSEATYVKNRDNLIHKKTVIKNIKTG